jgi:putative Mn2+ efflux pump MntP
MSLFDIFLLALALAMDCFAVSIISGIIINKIRLGIILCMAVLFGGFQALMPLIGWFVTGYFRVYIESIDHWVAFGLLLCLGAKMIKDSFDKTESKHFNPCSLLTQLLLAVATSIDALAVGISFACLGYVNISQMVVPLVIIGIVSFVMSVVGNVLGVRFGKAIAHRAKPDLIGGVLLILIGIKILITHVIEEGLVSF